MRYIRLLCCNLKHATQARARASHVHGTVHARAQMHIACVRCTCVQTRND